MMDHPSGPYISTACAHALADRSMADRKEELHKYCANDTGLGGTKTPAQCKWCGMPCHCCCHYPEQVAE